MKLKPIKKMLALILTLSMALGCSATAFAAENINSEPAKQVAEQEKLTIEQSSVSLSMGADETQMNFTWYCNQSENGILYLAKQSELVNGEMPENAKAVSAVATAANKTGYYSNQATATDLERDTVYAYQLVNGNTKSDIMTFTTGDVQNAFSFAFAGDPQIGAGNIITDTEGWDNTLNIIGDNELFNGIDFILSAGDQVNSAASEEEYNGYLEHSVLKSIPVATVVGNHDSSSDSYDQHFNVPNKSTYGETTASSDYYFVYNNVLFLVLNSNNRSSAEHKAFMEAAIADTAERDIQWKIVTFHHSIYSVASHAEDSDILQRRTELVPIFKELDIDIVLMGHDHVYCRTYMMDGLEPMTDTALYDDEDYSSITNPTGILYVTANSGSGSKYYNIQTSLELPYSKVMNQERVPNVSRVDISDECFTITTYRTSDMSVVDTFTINRTHIHNAVAKDAVPATCTQDGTVAYWYCEDCGKYFDDADCTNEITDLTIAAIGHVPDNPVISNATCTEAGSVIATCTVCGKEVTNEVIPAKGHTASDPVVTESTCNTHGSVTINCEECGVEISTMELPLTAHTPGEATVVKPTDTEDGSRTIKCVNCGEILSVEVLPATGEKIDEPPVPTKPDDSTDTVGNVPNSPQTGVDNPQGSVNAPQTGDTSNILLWIIMMIVSFAALSGTVIYSKRKKCK